MNHEHSAAVCWINSLTLFCFCIMLILAKYNGSDLFLKMNMQMNLVKTKREGNKTTPCFIVTAKLLG